MPPTDVKDFTEEQKRLFSSAASLGSGVQTINSGSLSETPTYDFTQAQQPPVYPVSGLNVTDMTPTPQEQKASTLTDSLTQLNEQLLGESQLRSELEQQQGLPELQRTQTDLTARLNALKNEALTIPLQLQQDVTGRGVTEGGLRPIQTAALRNNAIQALSTSSLLEASRGNITLAQDLVDRAVAQRFDPIREQITARTKNLELILNDPKTSLQDKNRAQKQKDIQDEKARQLAKSEATELAKGKAVLEYAGIADARTLKAMQEAPDAVAVLQIARQMGLTTPEQEKEILAQEKTRVEIDKIKADTLLTAAQRAKVLAETVPVNTVDAKKVLQNNEALTLAKELRKADAIGKGSAIGASAAKFVPFGQTLGLQGNRTAFEAKVDTLKANLTLDNLKLLKGAMSDKDLLFLNAIGSSLNVNMSEAAFDAELDRVITKLEGAGATVQGSTTTEVVPAAQVPDGYYQASDGLFYPE